MRAGGERENAVDRVIDRAQRAGLPLVAVTVTGSPVSAWRMNVGTARPSSGRILGP
jgi:hypothetical protein